jgi:hypothetical protein
MAPQRADFAYSTPWSFPVGAVLTPPCALFFSERPDMRFGDAFLTALMSAIMAAAVFYYTGSQLLREFGLPSDTTMLEFHKFMKGR